MNIQTIKLDNDEICMVWEVVHNAEIKVSRVGPPHTPWVNLEARCKRDWKNRDG